jgi:hypothetical protein
MTTAGPVQWPGAIRSTRHSSRRAFAMRRMSGSFVSTRCEPGFLALGEIVGDKCVYAGLRDSVELS